ncbi:MAG: GC-type dockerin domain-anchored protein [Phycisphaerales bacterium]
MRENHTPRPGTRLLVLGTLAAFGQAAQAQFVPLDRFLPPDARVFDQFGTDVAILEDRLLVTAPADDDVGPDAGVAFLFDTESGALVRTLAEPGLVGTDWYGYAAALSPAAAIVTAWGFDDGDGPAGAMFLYDRQTGSLVDTFTPSDAEFGDRFGFSIDADGSVAIAGAPNADGARLASGAAYLLDVRAPDAVDELGRLSASDGAQGSGFGFSVAIEGNLALVGAPRDNEIAASAGAAYLFDVSDPRQPVELAKLTASDAEAFDFFGKSVALHGTVAIVGAPDADQPGANGAGAAYLFDLTDPREPREVAILANADVGVLGNFGLHVATDGRAVLVGAPNDDAGAADAGAVFVYDARTGAPLEPIRAGAPSFGARFGTGLDFTGRRLAVGAPQDDSAGVRAGAAYVFAAPCPADLDGDGELTVFDFLAFQNLFDAGDPAADFDGDGELTIFDFLAFQNAFDAGC